MLDQCACGTVAELARREKVTKSFMSRVLRERLLAPDIVEAILDGKQPAEMRLVDLLEGFLVERVDQSISHGTADGGPR